MMDPIQAYLIRTSGLASGATALPDRHLIIVPCSFGRRLGAADRFDLGRGKLFHRKRLTIPPLKALLLAQLDNHDSAPPVRDNTSPHQRCLIR